MPFSAPFLKKVRLAHLYLGVFVAPAVLFFAFTGALQTFSFHETTPGSSYQPPRLFVVLGQIHKKQTPVIPVRKPGPPPQGPNSQADHHAPGDQPSARGLSPAAPNAPRPAPESAPKHNPLPLKIFFLLVAISLCLSTFTGISMAYFYARNKRAITTLLVLGTVIPVLMILL